MIIWLLLIFVEVYRNYYMIEIKKESPWYLLSFIFRAMAFILHGALIMNVGPGSWDVFVMQIGSFYLLFDPLLNLFRKKSFWYTGANNASNSGWIDKYIGSHPWLFWGIKIITLIVTLIAVAHFYIL